MTPTEAIAHCVTKKLPGARVWVDRAEAGYRVVIVAEEFRGLDKPAAAGLAYEALERLPLTLLARVAAIEPQAPLA